MRPRQLRRLYALMAFGAITAGAIMGTAVAKAAPDVCGALSVSPTVGTVEQLVYSFMADGIPPSDAGEIIAANVLSRCPEFRPVLAAFVRAYAPKGQLA